MFCLARATAGSAAAAGVTLPRLRSADWTADWALRTGSESLVSESRFWPTSESVSVVIASRSRLLPLFARFEALARRWAPWLVWSTPEASCFVRGAASFVPAAI